MKVYIIVLVRSIKSHTNTSQFLHPRVRKLGRILVVRLVKVSLLLVLVLNSVTSHAGSARTDANRAFTCAADTNRYRVHFVNSGYSLPDGIDYLQNLKRRSLQAPSTSQSDLDVLLGAGCDGPSAVDKASTEAFASPRRSDEPNLASSAALMQKVDRVIRTRRPGSISKKIK